MHRQSKELREQRMRLTKEMQEMVTNAESREDPKGLTEEEGQKFDKMDADINLLTGRIHKIERAFDSEIEQFAQAEERHEAATGSVKGTESAEEQRKAKEAAYDKVFRKWAVYGMGSLNAKEQNTMAGRFHASESRQQGTTPDAAGGYWVPEAFMYEFDQALKAFGGMRAVARIQTTSTGAAMPFPTVNDTSVMGEIVGENLENSVEDIVFGQVLFGSYMFSSKIVQVSQQLLQDSAFDMNTVVPQLLGERVARIQNQMFTTGTGTAQPLGIVPASTLGDTAGSATALSYDDLLNLEHSVDPAYRANGPMWMFADSTLKLIKALVDGENRPLWLPGIAFREPDTILGYTYQVNQDVPAATAGLVAVLFGALNKYMIRDVLGLQMLRLTERYAEFLQVGFLGFSRADGNLVDAGTNPVKHLVMGP